MPYSLGLDLGGTNLKAACVSHAGATLLFKSLEIGPDWKATVKNCLTEIERELNSAPMRVGVAAPGLVARNGRSIAFMPGRLPGLEGLDWTEFLNAPAPVAVFNDAHAALLGEQACGAAAGFSDVIMLTLGTGVGGAIVSGGKLLKGHLGRAGHLGHISLDPRGAPDITKTPGSLEDAIGECTLLKRSNGKFSTTRDLLEAAKNGDSQANEVWIDSIRALAAALAGFINTLDPEAVILGGGIANSGPQLFDPLEKFLDQFEWRPANHRAKILLAQLGGKAGALGAAHHAASMLSDKLKAFFDY